VSTSGSAAGVTEGKDGGTFDGGQTENLARATSRMTRLRCMNGNGTGIVLRRIPWNLPVTRFKIGWDIENGGIIMGPYSTRTRWPK
jgi:hypothetical protein